MSRLAHFGLQVAPLLDEGPIYPEHVYRQYSYYNEFITDLLFKIEIILAFKLVLVASVSVLESLYLSQHQSHSSIMFLLTVEKSITH